MMMNDQLVSALMITGKTPRHRRMADVAVNCFINQTYPNKELVIINTASDAPWFPDYMYWDHRLHSITEVCIPQKKMKLGDLRNLSMDAATGDLMIQWDDDDWHHPDRITFQVENHLPGRITILRNQYRLNVLKGFWGILDAKGWPIGGIVGTMIHGPTDLRYPSRKKSEDSAFIRKWKDSVDVVDNPAHLYVRIYHGKNTWDRNTIMKPVRGEGSRLAGDAEFINKIRKLYKA